MFRNLRNRRFWTNPTFWLTKSWLANPLFWLTKLGWWIRRFWLTPSTLLVDESLVDESVFLVDEPWLMNPPFLVDESNLLVDESLVDESVFLVDEPWLTNLGWWIRRFWLTNPTFLVDEPLGWRIRLFGWRTLVDESAVFSCRTLVVEPWLSKRWLTNPLFWLTNPTSTYIHILCKYIIYIWCTYIHIRVAVYCILQWHIDTGNLSWVSFQCHLFSIGAKQVVSIGNLAFLMMWQLATF